MPARRHTIILTLALAATTAPALAQPVFQEVAAERSLSFFNAYGPTFTFSTGGYPPSLLALMQRNMGNGVAIADIDDDGDLDVYLLSMLTHSNRLFRNDLDTGTPGFTDITESSGLGHTGFSRVAHFADLDNDGLRDLILINDSDLSGVHPPSAIYAGTGAATFVDVTAGSGFAPVGLIKGGAATVDFDGDGLLDIYVTTWCASGTGVNCSYPGHNRLYRNLGALTFQDVTTEVGLGHIANDSFTPIFADFDNDGDPDLFIAIDHKADYMFRNDGGVFTDVSVATNMTHTGNDMGVAVADYDADGDLDVYATNITDTGGWFGTTAYNTLHTNLLANTGQFRFIDLAQARAVEHTFWGWGTAFADIDNDGDLDLYAVNGFDEFVSPVPSHVFETPSVLFLNHGASFTRSTGNGADVVCDARALAAFDYDRDGDIDFLITNVNEPVLLLENRTPGTGNWLSVRPRGGCGVNHDAVGARVTVHADGRTLMQEVISSQSYLTGNPSELHFGLGDATMADTVEVRWPNGDTRTLTNVAANRPLFISHAPDADITLDGAVDFADLNALLDAWNRPDTPADIDRDGLVTFADLNELLDRWGDTCAP